MNLLENYLTKPICQLFKTPFFIKAVQALIDASGGGGAIPGIAAILNVNGDADQHSISNLDQLTAENVTSHGDVTIGNNETTGGIIFHKNNGTYGDYSPTTSLGAENGTNSTSLILPSRGSKLAVVDDIVNRGASDGDYVFPNGSIFLTILSDTSDPCALHFPAPDFNHGETITIRVVGLFGPISASNEDDFHLRMPDGTSFNSLPGDHIYVFKSDGYYWYLISKTSERPYRSYVARLYQSGTDAPTATVLENDLSVELEFTRNGSGQYSIGIVGGVEFQETSTFVQLSFYGNVSSAPFAGKSYINTLESGKFFIQTIEDDSGTGKDGVLWANCFELRMYPPTS